MHISMYLNYCRGLRFDEGPGYIYMYLRELVCILFRTLNYNIMTMFLTGQCCSSVQMLLLQHQLLQVGILVLCPLLVSSSFSKMHFKQ